jgi:hypothetical protein
MFEALTRAFTPSRTSARIAQTQNAATLTLQRKAAVEQERANKIAEAAMVNAADSESARSAADDRLRKLARAMGLGGTNRGGGQGGASVGYKTLMGS